MFSGRAAALLAHSGIANESNNNSEEKLGNYYDGSWLVKWD
jgi:hypothetical protein